MVVGVKVCDRNLGRHYTMTPALVPPDSVCHHNAHLGDLSQVKVCCDTVDNGVHAGRGYKLHAVAVGVVQVKCPVVDLHARHDGIVGLGGVHCLANQLLQVL